MIYDSFVVAFLLSFETLNVLNTDVLLYWPSVPNKILNLSLKFFLINETFFFYLSRYLKPFK